MDMESSSRKKYVACHSRLDLGMNDLSICHSFCKKWRKDIHVYSVNAEKQDSQSEVVRTSYQIHQLIAKAVEFTHSLSLRERIGYL
jgi:hypothetical protein